MKRLIAILALCLPLAAQTTNPALPLHFFGLGAGYNPSQAAQTTRAMGSTVIGMQVSAPAANGINNPLYWFNNVDFFPLAQTVNGKPHTSLMSAVTTGFCEVTNTIKSLLLGACIEGGFSTITDATGNVHLGGAVNPDGFVAYRFGKSKQWGVALKGGIFKSSLADLQTPLRFYVLRSF